MPDLKQYFSATVFCFKTVFQFIFPVFKCILCNFSVSAILEFQQVLLCFCVYCVYCVYSVLKHSLADLNYHHLEII